MPDLSMPGSAAGKLARCALYAVFGIWLAATVLSSDPWRKFERVRRLDKTGMIIPEWRFFAPRPGMHDTHLLVRDELPNGDLTPWREVIGIEDRKWHHFIWFPGRRTEKVIGDVASEFRMMEPQLRERHEVVQTSLAYLTLLNYVIHKVRHHPETKGVQFMLATSAGHDISEEPRSLLTSNLHPVS